MNKNNDLCSNISVIPQYEGTCWFNAILMICFYSQGVRNLLIKHSYKWNSKESLFKFFKTIFKYSHTKSTKTLDLFIKVKPEIVLLKIMENYDDILKDFMKAKNKKNPIYNFYWGHNVRYICDFLHLLKVPYISINYLSNANKFMFNLPELTSLWFYLELKEKGYMFADIHFNDYINEIKETIKNTPEVIIINEGINKYDSIKYNPYIDKFGLNNFKLKYTDYNSIKNLNDIITFNGTKYKLESCICVNYNKTDENNYHAIAGITCNDNKYVYNGWNSFTADAGFKNTLNVKVSPCSLMKFDWDIHKNSEFCLNVAKCKLDPLITNHYDIKRDLCFNFANNKSGRLLVYVKINEDNNEMKLKGFESTSDLSGKDELLDNFYKIDTLNLTEIIKLISNFNFHFFDLINENFKVFKDINVHILESFKDIDHKNILRVKEIIHKYYPKAQISDHIDTRDFYEKYIQNFFYKEKIERHDIVKDINKLMSEIKQYNIKIPKYYTTMELNELLFNLKKIEGDLHYFDFYFKHYSFSYYEEKDKMWYFLKFLEKISIYYPNKIKLSDKKLLKELAKKLLNKVYLLKGKVELTPKIQKRIKPMTKPEIIINIKKLNPTIKGLTAKKKEELLLIYSKLLKAK